MRQLMRLALVALAMFNLALGLGFLFAPLRLAPEFFVEPSGVQGMATIRADFPAFFITVAGFMLHGARTTHHQWLLVPITLLGIALFGRFVSIALDGMVATTLPPMVVEAVMLAVLALAYRVFGRPRQLVQ